MKRECSRAAADRWAQGTRCSRLLRLFVRLAIGHTVSPPILPYDFRMTP